MKNLTITTFGHTVPAIELGVLRRHPDAKIRWRASLLWDGYKDDARVGGHRMTWGGLSLRIDNGSVGMPACFLQADEAQHWFAAFGEDFFPLQP